MLSPDNARILKLSLWSTLKYGLSFSPPRCLHARVLWQAEQIYVTTTAIFEEGPVNSTKTHSSDDTPKIMYESVPDEINSEDSFDEIPDFD